MAANDLLGGSTMSNEIKELASAARRNFLRLTATGGFTAAMVAGGGIKGGAVYGESDARAAYVKSNPVTLEDFTATMLSAMSINPASRISPDGFTVPASPGNPIAALL